MAAIALARQHLWLALEGFHCPQLTQILRNSRSLCIIHLQIPSVMPLEMRKVQLSPNPPTWVVAVAKRGTMDMEERLSL